MKINCISIRLIQLIYLILIQISDDLVPITVQCIQASQQPVKYVFNITAVNSKCEKILNVKLTQPGTKLGQASDCFVYWKDVQMGDTWGLNFTSPKDAKTFHSICSLLWMTSSQRRQQLTQQASSQSSQCTCHLVMDSMDQLHKQRNGRIRFQQIKQRTQQQRSFDEQHSKQTIKTIKKTLSHDDVTKSVGTNTESSFDSKTIEKLLNDSQDGSTSNDRSRVNRSIEGRRRSLERSKCIDIQSPDDQSEDELQQFDLVINKSMNDLQKLIKQIEFELEIIKNEEKLLKMTSAHHQFKSQQNLTIDSLLPSVGASSSLHQAISLPNFFHSNLLFSEFSPRIFMDQVKCA